RTRLRQSADGICDQGRHQDHTRQTKEGEKVGRANRPAYLEPKKAAPGRGVIRTSRSGRWSAPDTWEEGKVPGAGTKVRVRAGHTVTTLLRPGDPLDPRRRHRPSTARAPSGSWRTRSSTSRTGRSPSWRESPRHGGRSPLGHDG